MKIAVFLDLYEPLHHSKDGNVLLGLQERGAQVTLVTEEKSALDAYDPPFPVIESPASFFARPTFWRGIDADLVLAYTWLNRRYNPVVRAIKEADKRVLIRSDRDGRIGYPLLPREYYLHPLWTAMGIRNLVRRTGWRVFGRRLRVEALQQFALADALYIESEEARHNLADLLECWGRPELIEKIHHIPIAVSDAFVTPSIPEKKPQVVAVGRWDDRWVKNTFTAVRVLTRLLALRTDCRVVMLGTGEALLRGAFEKSNSPHSERFSVLGHRPQEEVAEILGRSMVFFLPSRTEAFPLAAGEAVCMGCTVVGSDLEAVRSLAKSGFSGTVAPGFQEDALLAALLQDLERWKAGRYGPADIAETWRARFDRRRVADRILELAGRLIA
jgi:glycosyltransferase involved in cell wall biosynthesis